MSHPKGNRLSADPRDPNSPLAKPRLPPAASSHSKAAMHHHHIHEAPVIPKSNAAAREEWKAIGSPLHKATPMLPPSWDSPFATSAASAVTPPISPHLAQHGTPSSSHAGSPHTLQHQPLQSHMNSQSSSPHSRSPSGDKLSSHTSPQKSFGSPQPVSPHHAEHHTSHHTPHHHTGNGSPPGNLVRHYSESALLHNQSLKRIRNVVRHAGHDAASFVRMCFPHGKDPGFANHRFISTRRGMRRRDGNFVYYLKWLCPFVFCGFGFYIQSVFLHYATYGYVQRMLELTPDQRSMHRYSTLSDPLADLLGHGHFQMGLLDGIAVVFPFLFMVFSFLRSEQTLQVWTKVMICGGFLFITKGLLGAMTIVPDAEGWSVCVNERLHAEGLQWMASKSRSLWEFFVLDFRWMMRYHRPLRYCSDMMYSGHTFTVTLFALGCYEQLRIVLEGPQVKRWFTACCCACRRRDHTSHHAVTTSVVKGYTCFKLLSLFLLSTLAVFEQIAEIYTVLKTRFHYSSDIVVALLLTFAFYTNSAIAVFAKQWELRGMNIFLGLPGISSFEQAKFHEYEADQERWRFEEMWISKGDVYIPVCCFPFCCMSGRGHLYTDDGLLEIYNEVIEMTRGQSHQSPEDHLKNLIEEMNLIEGVPQAEALLLWYGGHERLSQLQQLKVRLLKEAIKDPHSQHVDHV